MNIYKFNNLVMNLLIFCLNYEIMINPKFINVVNFKNIFYE